MWPKLAPAIAPVPSLERETVTVSDQVVRSVRPTPGVETVHVTWSSVPDCAVGGTVTAPSRRSAYGIGIRSSGAAAEAALFDSEPFSNTTPPASATTNTVNRPVVAAGVKIVSVRL